MIADYKCDICGKADRTTPYDNGLPPTIYLGINKPYRLCHNCYLEYRAIVNKYAELRDNEIQKWFKQKEQDNEQTNNSNL